MRVIAGKAKSKKLKSPPDFVRPLSDRAKETLFNILAPYINDARFLDLFAGSGSVAIEALSRGANLAILVEKSREAVRCINDNLKLVKLADRAEVFQLEVARALKILSSKGAKFDIIYVGAPYGSNNFIPSLEQLAQSTLPSSQAIVIAEHRSKDKLPDNFFILIKYREKKLGDTTFSFYKAKHK